MQINYVFYFPLSHTKNIKTKFSFFLEKRTKYIVLLSGDTSINMAVLSRFFTASFRPCKAFRLVEQCDYCLFNFEFSFYFYLCVCFHRMYIFIVFDVENVTMMFS